MCEMAVEHAPDYRVWWNVSGPSDMSADLFLNLVTVYFRGVPPTQTHLSPVRPSSKPRSLPVLLVGVASVYGAVFGVVAHLLPLPPST